MGSKLNLNRLSVFVAIVEAGSLTAAAARLRMTKTVVSTHLQRLEEELGASLVVRTTRRLSLTDAGREFYDACRRILGELDDAIALAGRGARLVRGHLRVTSSVDYGASVLAPLAARLTQQHPQLTVELLLSDHVLDLLAEGVDAAVRTGPLADSSHQGVRIGRFEQWLIAPGSWAERVAAVDRPREAATLPFVASAMLRQPLVWTFARQGETEEARFAATVSANTSQAVRACVEAGGGLAILPDFAVKTSVEAGGMIRLLADWSLPSGDLHCLWPAARQRPQRLQVFVEALKRTSLP